MIKMYKATRDDIDALMDMRLKMLREVNKLPEEHEFPEEFVNFTKLFFLHGNQTTWIVDDGGAVGCASICYYELMPTFDHPSGRRAQIMNVYTRPEYRKKGYASTLLRLLIEDAKDRGVRTAKNAWCLTLTDCFRETLNLQKKPDVNRTSAAAAKKRRNPDKSKYSFKIFKF